MSFRGAPLSKVLAYSCFLGPLVGSFVSRGLLSSLTLSSSRHVYGPRPEIWRLFTSILSCDALIAAGVSCYLLWKLRLFERQMGSSKFAAFVVSSGLVAVAARAGLVAIPFLGAAGLSSGPFHVIFGLIPLYFCALLSIASVEAAENSLRPTLLLPGRRGAQTPSRYFPHLRRAIF